MENQLNKSDELAIERTKLANERTFLAYFRTAIVFLSSGVAIVRIDPLKKIAEIGILLIALAPLLLIVGIYRYFKVNKRLKKA